MINFLKKVVLPALIIYLFVLSPYSLVLSPARAADETDTKEEVFYYLNDHLGGIDAVTDENGNVVEHKDYLPYGDERLIVGDSGENYGFTGKEKDESGLYYYGARYYDPKLARFTQIDPLVMSQSEKSLASVLDNPQALNGYSYVLNNPLKYVDEEGMYEIDVHFDLTLYLGKQAGFTDGDALVIAYSNQYTDANPDTSPWNKNSGWKHFANTDVAKSWIKDSIKEKNLDKFGESLHYFQDTYSHYMNGYSWSKGGHTLDSLLSYFGIKKSPDKTYNNVSRADDMTKASFYEMRDYYKEVYGTGKLTSKQYDKESDNIWGNISSYVSKFNSSNDSQKSVYFEQSGYEKMERSLSESKISK
jgi:RHS repeat-associated protein